MGPRSLPRPRVPAIPSWSVLRRGLLLAALLVAALVALYLLWLRDSSLVAVEDVRISGAEQSPAVETALADAAAGMSTLQIDRAALERAVADDPSVVSIDARAEFPDGLELIVELRPAAGYLEHEDGGGEIVAADGVVLEGFSERPQDLPLIDAGKTAPGERLDGGALAVSRVLGAAPGPLARQLESGTVTDEHGVVITVEPGIELRFGDPEEADLKWIAAATVLADPGLTNATYVDLAAPERPVAGTG